MTIEQAAQSVVEAWKEEGERPNKYTAGRLSQAMCNLEYALRDAAQPQEEKP